MRARRPARRLPGAECARGGQAVAACARGSRIPCAGPVARGGAHAGGAAVGFGAAAPRWSWRIGGGGGCPRHRARRHDHAARGPGAWLRPGRAGHALRAVDSGIAAPGRGGRLARDPQPDHSLRGRGDRGTSRTSCDPKRCSARRGGWNGWSSRSRPRWRPRAKRSATSRAPNATSSAARPRTRSRKTRNSR